MSDRDCFVCGATRDTRQIPIGNNRGKWRCEDDIACSVRFYDQRERAGCFDTGYFYGSD